MAVDLFPLVGIQHLTALVLLPLPLCAAHGHHHLPLFSPFSHCSYPATTPITQTIATPISRSTATTTSTCSSPLTYSPYHPVSPFLSLSSETSPPPGGHLLLPPQPTTISTPCNQPLSTASFISASLLFSFSFSHFLFPCYFPLIVKGKTYKKIQRKIIINKIKNYKCSLLRFLEKYADRNMISTQPLCPFDHASNRSWMLSSGNSSHLVREFS